MIEPDREALYRKICRWFSREYHTPLPEVEWDLEPGYVLMHYFEYHLGRLHENKDTDTSSFTEWSQEVDRITSDGSDEVIKQQRQEDDDWAEQMRREIKEQEEKSKQNGKLEKHTNPNLEDEIIASRSGETEPPNFPEE